MSGALLFMLDFAALFTSYGARLRISRDRAPGARGGAPRGPIIVLGLHFAGGLVKSPWTKHTINPSGDRLPGPPGYTLAILYSLRLGLPFLLAASGPDAPPTG